MTQPQNLSPAEWSKVLQSDQHTDIQKVAASLQAGYEYPWVKALLDATADCHSVLDMGAGRGELAATLAKKGRDMTLLDWSEGNIGFEQGLFDAMGLKGRFQRADMTQPLPFKDGTFDAVYSCGVFEYFQDDVIRAILKEAFRIARKRVMIMVPNAWSLPYRCGKWYLERKKAWVWGGEHPFATLKPHFRSATKGPIREYSVGTRHSLDFLTMPGGPLVQKAVKKVFRLKDHPNPSFLNQGYLLITIGEKL